MERYVDPQPDRLSDAVPGTATADPTPGPSADPAPSQSPDPTPTPTPAPPAPAAGTIAGAGAGIPLRPATAAQEQAVPRPVSLTIEGTAINVGVIEVGIEDGNKMEIPESFYEAGWYRFGPAPGASEGNAVLAAHIDIGTEQMPFAQLKNVPLGTVITVGRENAEPVRYRVTSVENQPKAGLNTEEIFRRDGAHQLVVVTCGGKWLADKGDYEDNVVLTASPL